MLICPVLFCNCSGVNIWPTWGFPADYSSWMEEVVWGKNQSKIQLTEFWIPPSLIESIFLKILLIILKRIDCWLVRKFDQTIKVQYVAQNSTAFPIIFFITIIFINFSFLLIAVKTIIGKINLIWLRLIILRFLVFRNVATKTEPLSDYALWPS